MNEADVLTNSDYFSVNSEGELTFTEQGIAEYRSYFGKGKAVKRLAIVFVHVYILSKTKETHVSHGKNEFP